MNKKLLFFAAIILLHFSVVVGQTQPKGKLFIIGGGKRTPQLMKTLLAAAQLKTNDYIAVLPMASEETDTAYYYVRISLEKLCANTIANLNFTADKVNDKHWLDSLQYAKLIFICGGDQSRFMKAVLQTPVYAAIHKAYMQGATIAGTSAGAAVMSKQMVTGNELSDTAYHETFRKLHADNLELQEGLGLIDSAVIDQHFIARSRYNRLLSALQMFPAYPCIGIDEATAIIVHGNNVSVTGTSQVVVFTHPKNLQVTPKGLIKLSDVQLSIYTDGDKFLLKEK